MKKIYSALRTPMMLNVLVSALVLALTPQLALAVADPGSVLCTIALYAQGNLGKGVATLAVVSLGIGAAFGRASWTQVLLVCTGIAVAAGATILLAAVALPSC